jgi:hypothetical protein
MKKRRGNQNSSGFAMLKPIILIERLVPDCDDTGKTLPDHGRTLFWQGHETLLRCFYMGNGIVFGVETSRKS